MYQLDFHRQVKKDLQGIDKSRAEEIRRATNQLAINPRPEGCAKLEGLEAYRLRVGIHYRVAYTIDELEKTVTIQWIGHRQKGYKIARRRI